MGRTLQELQRFLQELKRRNVYKVAVAYAVVAFIGFQAAKLLIPSTVLPAWTDEFFLFLLIIGFPVAVVVAWAFELTPEGVRRTAEVESEAPKTEAGTRTAYKGLIGLGLVAAAVLGGWYLTGGGGSDTEPRLGNRSIAVIPFDELGEEEPGTFTEGMHDDLLARLSNVSGLKVISRTAVQKYRGSEMTTGEIARELGVKWVMEGGVQEMGDQIQVNAQLIDPRTETHAWAESYRRDLTARSLFELQSEITKRIAQALEARLTQGETDRVDRRPTENLEAYKLYVQGRSQLDTRTTEGMQEAVEYFQRAIEHDSTFALAWAGLADAIGLLYTRYSPDSVPSSMPGQEFAARRAVELDPELAEAHASLGLVHHFQNNAPAALRDLRRAVDLKPSYAQAHHWLALLLLEIGRLEAGHEHVSLAVQLNPRHASARAVLVWASIAQGNPEAAQTHLQRLSGLTEERRRELAGLILYHAGRWDELEALALGQLEEKGAARRFVWHFFLTRIAALRGDTSVARDHLAAIREEEAHFLEGLAHAALGETDAAFAAWGTVEWIPGRHFRYYFSDIWDSLRDDPRYGELTRRANEQWGLNPDGSLPDSVDVSFEVQSDE